MIFLSISKMWFPLQPSSPPSLKMSGCNNLDKPNLGLDSNPDQSTGSVLGELIKDLDIPAIETLIETPQNLTEDATQVQATFNLVQGVNGEQELQVRRDQSIFLSPLIMNRDFAKVN